MHKNQIHVLALFSERTKRVEDFERSLQSTGLSFSLQKAGNVFDQLIGELEQIQADKQLIYIREINDLYWNASSFELLQEVQPGSVVAAASALFDFQNPDLRYFYWKHYPRKHFWYNYLDSSLLQGAANDFIKLINDLRRSYADDVGGNLQYLLNRYYADQENGCFQPDIRIQLDHNQQNFASTVYSTKHKLTTSWMYAYLYMRNEAGRGKHLLNISRKNGKFQQFITGTNPALVSTTISSGTKGTRWAALKTFKEWLFIGRINKWNFDTRKIFRYRLNQSQVLDQGTKAIVERLEEKKPLSFAHYNDGELTFIRDYLKGETHEKWFGRKQQKYDPLLAERLHNALKYQKEGYFVGVPCSTDHPELRGLADEIVGEYEFKVQAMSLHHNLAYMPRILHALRDRNCYFFTNEQQDLSLFRHLGVVIEENKVIKVPFKNSYLEYEKYSNMDFPENAVVILTCGMLAKILTHIWYKRHESLTILALGSSLDDHIQKANINFELYPKDTPLTRNIKFSRSFLFGYKKPCKECYDL